MPCTQGSDAQTSFLKKNTFRGSFATVCVLDVSHIHTLACVPYLMFGVVLREGLG